jgi:hypothetical protein
MKLVGILLFFPLNLNANLTSKLSRNYPRIIPKILAGEKQYGIDQPKSLTACIEYQVKESALIALPQLKGLKEWKGGRC